MIDVEVENVNANCWPAKERNMYSSKIGFVRLFLLAFLVNLLAQAFHETVHLLAYQAYRRNPTWGFIGLVQLWNTQPENLDHWVKTSTPDGEIGWLRLDSLPTDKSEIAIIGAAGPIASLASALLGLWAALKFKNRNIAFKYTGLMLALSISLTMMLYYLRSPFRTIGDEYDIATYFGIAKFVVEIPFALAFTSCFVLGLRVLDTWQIRKIWLVSTFLGSLLSGILLVTLDGGVREAVNEGIPLFQSVLGYSMPVLITYVLAFLCIIIWQRNAQDVSKPPIGAS